MRTAWGVLTAVLVLAPLGCRRSVPVSETLLIAGSSAVKAYLDPLLNEFCKRNPAVSVTSEGGGGVAAVLALKQDSIDVAALSRMADAEMDDPYLREYQISRDGVAVVVSESNPVRGLSRAQVTGVFLGRITNWLELGGPNAPITVYRREATAHSHRSFTALVLDGDEPFAGSKVVSSIDELKKAIRANPLAIGYMSMGNVQGVRALDIDGVPLTRLTALSGRYPLARAFYLALYLTPAPQAERLVEFALSPEGQAVLASQGLIPVR